MKLTRSFIIYTAGNYLLQQKAFNLFVISLIELVLNLIPNYVLKNKYQTIGATYSTAITYFVMSALTVFVAIKIQKLPWRVWKE